MKRVTMLAALVGLLLPAVGQAEDSAPLVLEAKIALGAVAGRIDHFAVGPDRQLLFVAELGNDSVGIIDLKERKVLHRLTGLSEPQGVAYHPATSTLYVANAGDGSVRLFQGPDFTPAGGIALGDDADNIRVDSWRNRIVVGYGKGALAVIDPASRKKASDMPLKGHPESFQFDETGSRIFVNVPGARQIAVLDVASNKQISTLETAGASSNFAMAVDPDEHRLLVVFRSPAKLTAFATPTGKLEGSFDTCRDADDVFVDSRRRRLYVSCGEGVIDVLAQSGSGYERIARIPTVAGARTSLFVPANDRFYLGVRATASEPAAIWVFRPPS
jgi:DNA-binding beta-propeller fold protein YncE